jgi:two-component system sensor histidine kinase CiaH
MVPAHTYEHQFALQQRIQTESDILPLPGFDIRALRADQAHEAAASLFISLLYTNILILAGGGIGSYLLARRTLQPIEYSYEAQSRFTSDASHELRTPLAVMKTELEVALRDPTLSKKEMKELLNSNLEEVNKLTKLSHTLLQLSRLDHTGLTTEKIAVNEIVRSAIAHYDKTGRRIHFSGPARTPYASGNAVSIEELVTILIDNAVKYSPDDSVVEVTVTSGNRQASIKVKNSGEGIDASDLPHVFNRFFRVDSSRTGGTKSGYGLGLSLAKKIVELHNGDLSASSARNAETVFTVKLPLHSRNFEAKREKLADKNTTL